jgi:outer membrane protein assembly factor BamA
VDTATSAASTPPPAAPIPSDAQLQASGALIGSIDIKVVDVFDPENPKESGKLFRAANYLHINTREGTVRPQLLFKPGERYSRRLLDETARNLRDRSYLEDASVTPIAYHPETNTVDLLVRVHDVWTLNPGASYSHSGGANHSGVQISEGNLLGMGKSVSVDRDQNVDRSAWKFAYGDPNLFSSRWTVDAVYGDTSDGSTQKLEIVRPFYSLDTRWSGGFQWNTDKRLEERFQKAVAVDQYLADRKDADAQLAWSTGLRNGNNNGPAWIERLSVGYHVNDQSFSADPEKGTLLVPENIRLHYPYIGLTWFQDDYVVVRNRDQIARTEDLYLGRKFDVRIGYASMSTGSDRNATVLTTTAQDAYQLGGRQFLLVKLGIEGRLESGQWRGTTFTGSLRYDVRQTAKAMFVAMLNHVQMDHPDDSQQLYLGSDEGLRGYDLRYRSGTGRTVLILEQRVYTDVQILRLLSVAGAAFIDAGKIHGENDPFSDGKSVFTDVGLGLRLGNIRSSGGDIFHIDLAYPINATGSDRKLQYSIVTKSGF